MSSDRYPLNRMVPLQIEKRAGINSPGRSISQRPRAQSGTSTISDQSSLQSPVSSTYPDSASAAHIAAVFIAEVDTWILDIRRQLDELEEKHANHRKWLANGGADDLSSIESIIHRSRKVSDTEGNGMNRGAGTSENHNTSPESNLSTLIRGLSSVRQDAETTHRDA